MNAATESLLREHHYHDDQEVGYGTTELPTEEVSTNASQATAIHKRQRRLLLAMALILPYIGLVITLLAANNFDQDKVIERFYFTPFHMYEFWGAVYFALVEGYVLLVADDCFLSMDQTSQSILVHLLSINIITSTTAAALFTLSPSIFEIPAHFIEYASQLTVTLIDAYFMILPRNGSNDLRNRKQMGDWIPLRVQKGYFVLLVLADIAKFVLYTEVVPTAIGKERSSHYVEFMVELLNSLWAFMYIKDLYMQSLWQQRGVQ